MSRQITLNEKEIRQILAEHFHVEAEAVTINKEEITVGYGVGEHIETAVSARIDI